MPSIRPMLIGAGLSFLVVFLSGIWLTRSGKPYSGTVLTIHKLISLAAVAFLVVAAYRRHRAVPLSQTELILGVVTGLLAVASIVSGGLVSTDTSLPAAVLLLHRIAPFVTVISAAATVYLMLGGV